MSESYIGGWGPERPAQILPQQIQQGNFFGYRYCLLFSNFFLQQLSKYTITGTNMIFVEDLKRWLPCEG